MKKFLFLIAAALVMLVACNPKDHYEFNNVVLDDYALVSAQYDTVFFFEAQAKYDKAITEEGAKVIWVYSVFGIPRQGTVLITHEEGNYKKPGKLEFVKDQWLEDIRFNPEVTISLEDALTALLSAEMETPATKLVVMRKPLWYPEPENPYYIFGDTGHGFAKVDTETGEVTAQN